MPVIFLTYFGMYLKGNTFFSQEKHMYNNLIFTKKNCFACGSLVSLWLADWYYFEITWSTKNVF